LPASNSKNSPLLEPLTFSQSMQIILDALLDTVMEFFHITEAKRKEE